MYHTIPCHYVNRTGPTVAWPPAQLSAAAAQASGCTPGEESRHGSWATPRLLECDEPAPHCSLWYAKRLAFAHPGFAPDGAALQRSMPASEPLHPVLLACITSCACQLLGVSSIENTNASAISACDCRH